MVVEMRTATIRQGGSRIWKARDAVAELREAIWQRDSALVVLFCSPEYDRDELVEAVNERFAGQPVIGCTTAGEISPGGYLSGSLAGFSLGAGEFQVETCRIDDLRRFGLVEGAAAGAKLLQALRSRGGEVSGRNTFGFLLIDGLSVREEWVASSLYQALGDIPMFGGSAGDGTSFRETFVLHEGELRRDSAVFALVRTDRPFTLFKTQHFEPGASRMVVTGADAERRIVTEINGAPAGREYARMVGLEVDELTPMIFATHPVIVRIGGQPFVRSIQKVKDDGSLTFFCSIDEGLVLTVAHGVDFTDNLVELFTDVERQIGQPELVVGCDCILRLLEVQQTGLLPEVTQILRHHQVVGFSTYGEQYNGMHVNQTLTGVAIGVRGSES